MCIFSQILVKTVDSEVVLAVNIGDIFRISGEIETSDSWHNVTTSDRRLQNLLRMRFA